MKDRIDPFASVLVQPSAARTFQTEVRQGNIGKRGWAMVAHRLMFTDGDSYTLSER